MFTKAATNDRRQPQQEAQADGYGFDSIHIALQLRSYSRLINIHSVQNR